LHSRQTFSRSAIVRLQLGDELFFKVMLESGLDQKKGSKGSTQKWSNTKNVVE